MRKFTVFMVIAMFTLPLVSTAYGQQQEEGRAYFDFGLFSFEDGDYQDAEKNFQKALETSPDNAFYNQYMGKTYLKMARYQDAMTYFKKAMDADPDLSELTYDIAYLHYKMSNYPQAGALFAGIAEEEPNNVLAQYHAGICFFKQKQYGKALDYFLKAADLSPTVKTNGYYYAAVCYQKTGKTPQAVEAFEFVKQHAASEDLRASAVKWLQAIEKEQKSLKPYSLYLKIGGQYDDNVRLEPLDEDIYADEDDASMIAHFIGNYNVINRKSLVLGAGYSHYQSWYSDLDEYDMTGSTLNLYARYRFAPFTIGLSYLPSYYWVDDDDYLRQHQFRPEVMWVLSNKLVSRASYRYNDKTYFEEDGRDGHSQEGSLDLYYKIFNNKWRLSGGIGYENNDASDSDYDYAEFKSRIGVSVDFPWKLEVSLTGRYEAKRYDHEDIFYEVEREDDKYYAAAAVSRSVYFEWLRLLLEYNYTRNDSNIGDYDYERNVTTLSLAVRY